MNELDSVKAEVKTLSINFEAYKRDSDKCNEDVQIHLNDMGDQLDTIQNNHLVHIKADIEGLNRMLKIIEWGLAFLGLMIALFGVLMTVIQVNE